MRHRKAGRQFSRNTSHRRAMLRALATNLVAHERIETTEAKAKELRRVAERMITRALRLGPVAYTPHDKLSLADRARRQAAQRQMARFLRRFVVVTAESESKKIDVVEKVFVDLARRFKDRPGGYTRIIKTGRRRGDNAPMSIVELVVRGEAKDEKAKPGKGATKNEGPKPETPAKAAPAASGKDAEKGTAKAAESGEKGEKESAGAPKPAATDPEAGKTTKAAKAATNADATKPKAEAESSEDKAEAKKPRRAKSKPQGDGD